MLPRVSRMAARFLVVSTDTTRLVPDFAANSAKAMSQIRILNGGLLSAGWADRPIHPAGTARLLPGLLHSAVCYPSGCATGIQPEGQRVEYADTVKKPSPYLIRQTTSNRLPLACETRSLHFVGGAVAAAPLAFSEWILGLRECFAPKPNSRSESVLLYLRWSSARAWKCRESECLALKFTSSSAERLASAVRRPLRNYLGHLTPICCGSSPVNVHR